jgi:hypothetical protein
MAETDHSKNDRLKQDIEANLIRHCDLLGDNQTYTSLCHNLVVFEDLKTQRHERCDL